MQPSIPIYQSDAEKRARQKALTLLKPTSGWRLELAGNPIIQKDGYSGYSFFWYPEGAMRDNHTTLIKVYVQSKADAGTAIRGDESSVGGAALARSGSPERRGEAKP